MPMFSYKLLVRISIFVYQLSTIDAVERVIMQSLAVVCLLVAGVFSVELEHDGDVYDQLDFKEIVETDELRNAAYDCLMDLGPCSTEYEIIREVIPRILKSKCADCNPSQKAIYEYTAGYLEKNYSEKFKKMVDKYGQ